MQFSASSSISASHTLGWDSLGPLLSCRFMNPGFPWPSPPRISPAGPGAFLEIQLWSACRPFCLPDALLGVPWLWGLLWLLLLSPALASSVSLLPQQLLAQALDHSYFSNLCPQGSALGFKIHFGHTQSLMVVRAWVVISSCPWVWGVSGSRTPGDPSDTGLAINLMETPVERREVDCFEKAA